MRAPWLQAGDSNRMRRARANGDLSAEPDDIHVATPLFRTRTHGATTRLYQWFVSEDDDGGQWRRVSRGDYRRMSEGRSL